VVRDTDLDPQSLVSLFGDHEASKFQRVLRYHAELVPRPGGSAIILWNLLDGVHRDAPDPEAPLCLDLACGNSQFLTVLASGGELWLHYQDMGAFPQSGVVDLAAGDWSLSAAPARIDPGETKAKITLNAENDWEVQVVQRNKQDGRTTLYRKAAGKWEFDVVSSNRDPAK
jgi:hypothetical protein